MRSNRSSQIARDHLLDSAVVLRSENPQRRVRPFATPADFGTACINLTCIGSSFRRLGLAFITLLFQIASQSIEVIMAMGKGNAESEG